MRIRTVIIGIATGVLCTITLWLYFYKVGLSKYIPGWAVDSPPQNPGLGLPFLVMALCGVVLFAAGWVSARWNWANTWQSSIAAGGNAGLLAGFLIYDFFGAIWSCVVGQIEALANIYNQVNEALGARIFITSMFDTNKMIYSNFIWCVLACMAIGMLGGFVSAVIGLNECWGTSPRNPEGWLFRLPVYLLVFFGFLSLTGTFALLGAFMKLMAEVPAGAPDNFVTELLKAIDQPDFMRSTYLVGWYFTILPVALIAGWFIRLVQQGGRITLLSFSGLTLLAATLLVGGWIIAPNMFSLRGVSSTLVLVLMVATFLAGWVGLITRDEAEGFPYHTSDWIGFLLGYGILGGTQVMMGILVYAVSFVGLTGFHLEHLVGGDVIDPSSIHNYFTRYIMFQSGSVIAAMILSSIIALIIANIVSFSRSFFDIRETYLAQEEEYLEPRQTI